MAPKGESEPERPWYASGLRFRCVPGCGGCCRNHGSYAFVYLDPGEDERIARFLRLPLGTFRRRYTTLDDGDRVLRMDEPACPFLSGTSCTIYPVRPLQCRTFPFWEENLLSRAAWTGLGRFCPGIDEGKLHPLHTIETSLLRRRTGDGT